MENKIDKRPCLHGVYILIRETDKKRRQINGIGSMLVVEDAKTKKKAGEEDRVLRWELQC